MKRIKLGIFGVDGNQVLICDPCYLPDFDLKEDNNGCPGWSKHIDWEAGGYQINYPLGHAGMGVAFSPAHGDGMYAVWAMVDNEGRILKVEIEF